MLKTCTFRERGVMTRWLRPLGRCVGANNHATELFCLGVVVSPGFCTLIY